MSELQIHLPSIGSQNGVEQLPGTNHLRERKVEGRWEGVSRTTEASINARLLRWVGVRRGWHLGRASVLKVDTFER